MAACSVLKIIMRWGSVSAAHLAHWARCRWISTELTPNSITSTLFMAINGVRYIKDIPETNTNIAVSYYRYTNDGYFSFNEANTRNWDYNSRQKSEIQFNISQTIFDGVSLYASGSQQDYWGNNDKTGISLLGFPASNGELVTA